eukprot:TRINITY_DN15480_c0_g1_i2.p1 TRINITY_DN15480_c0_g1~~TRINITY_DN15480_c0_g1_i2.p1  ORF type:complete len:493 (+),score=90.13 TRINITY_DN15480_c0_g1_i2:46-1524(+)
MSKIEKCQSVLSNYLSSNNISFLRVLSSVLCGSNSYNLALKDSDEDYLGVYLNTPQKHYSLSSGKGSYMLHGDIDLCIYEFGFFVKLLFKGNPKVVEHLLCKKDAYRDPQWEKNITPELVVNLINKVTFSQYFSFARNRISLAKEAESGSRERLKLQANAIRLLSESQRLYSGKLPEVTLTGDFRELLLSIRHNKLTEEEIEKEIKKHDISLAMPSSIPDTMPAQPFQELLQRVRRENYSCDPDPEFVALRDEGLVAADASCDDLVSSVQKTLVEYFGGDDGPVLLLSLAKLPDSSVVGIYAAPTSRIDGFIEGVSNNNYLPENLLITTTDDGVSTSVGIGSYLAGKKPKEGISTEVTLFEISTALTLINDRAHPWLFASIFSKDCYLAKVASILKSPEGSLPAVVSRGSVRCLLGRISGMQGKSHPSLTWVASFTQSLLNGVPDPATPPIDSGAIEELLKVQISEVELPDRIPTCDLFDEWLFKLRTAMRN